MLPPSVETSTPPTWPPPTSVAVPEIVTRAPSAIVPGSALMLTVGAEVSVVLVAAVRFD